MKRTKLQLLALILLIPMAVSAWGSSGTGATPSKAQTAGSVTGALKVSGISITQSPSGATWVDVQTTPATPFHVMELENPPRLVIDFSGARQATARRTYVARASGLLKDVRVGQFQMSPAIVRVVADLQGNPIFDVHQQADGVRIELKSRSEISQVSPASSAASAPAPTKEAAAPAKPANLEQAALNLHPDYQSALPSANPSHELASPRPEPPAADDDAAQAAKAAKVLSASLNDADAQGAGETASTTTEAKPKYTGEPISVNLKDVDLKDFFRLIHEISGLNILVDPDVTGSVTMVLDQVPWDQALDMVLRDNQLGKSLEGNVLRISKLSTLAAEQEQATKLAEATVEAQPLVSRFVTLNYAKASAVAALLMKWVGGGALTKRGSVLVDDRTNTLIVSDIASQIPVILPIIAKLDTKTAQVSIQARIVLTTKTFERDIDGALNNGTINKSGTTVTGGSVGTGASGEGVVPTPGSTTRVSLGQTTATGFGAYVINNQGARYFINAMLAAAESKSQAKTITQPSIVTQNNVPGIVLQGVQIPIQTSVNNTISIQYINAALRMTVTPQVTEDGHIFMNIDIINASPGAILTSAGPAINTQQATTQVLVPDGATIVFGGVSVDASTNTATYVPWVGQIPIFGHLFKTSTHNTNNSELLFFVTPKILPG